MVERWTELLLDGVQTGTDVAGGAPLLGEPFDLLNAWFSYQRGDQVGTNLSLAAAIPIAGNLATGAKIIKRTADVVDAAKGAEKALDAAKNTKKLLDSAETAAKNAKKMSPDDIGDFLKVEKDWHKGSAKKDFLKQFKKELKGDTIADFYIDKTTKEVFLKSNKSGNWINTGTKFE
jgi:hypothetical protein